MEEGLRSIYKGNICKNFYHLTFLIIVAFAHAWLTLSKQTDFAQVSKQIVKIEVINKLVNLAKFEK